MKKLNKLVLNKAKVMSAPEMIHITGGGSYDCSKADCNGSNVYVCVFTAWGSPMIGCGCGNTASECEEGLRFVYPNSDPKCW